MQDIDDKKYTKLLEDKVQKLGKDLSVLKAALLKEQALRKECEEKIRDKEIEARQKIEKIESLEFNNSRLTKRVESLMEEVNKKNEGKPSFINNLLHGKQKDEVEKLQNSLAIVTEDLHVKIEENEKLHIRMYEYKEEQKGKLETLEMKVQEYIKLNKEQDVLISELKAKKENLSKELDNVEARKRSVEKDLAEKIKEISEQEFTFKQEKEELADKVKEYGELVQRKIPFDEEKNLELYKLNAPKMMKPNDVQMELLGKVKKSGEQGLEKIDELIGAIVNKLVLISTYSETEDQKDYNEYSKEIRDLLPDYGKVWKDFFGKMFKILGVMNSLDLKGFRKNIQGFVKRATEIEEEGIQVMEGFPEVVDTFQNLEGILRKMFAEEISLVNDISFLKENNEKILQEFQGFVSSIINIHKVLREIMEDSLRKTLSFNNSLVNGSLWLKVAENLRKLSKNLENTVVLYREKLKQEEEGIEKNIEEGRLVYIFKEHIPVNKFRNINQNIASLFQGFATYVHSAIVDFAEYLERSFGSVVEENGTHYPLNSVGSAHFRAISLTQGLNTMMREQPKGIGYEEALNNKKALIGLKEKEIFYHEQTNSLRNALQQAESRTGDDESSVRKLPENNLERSLVSKIILFMKQKYEEACKKANEEPDYSSAGFNMDIVEKMLKEIQQKNSATNGRQNLFNNDLEHLSENVAKGLQRISMKFMNSQLKLVPLNSLTKADEDGSERTRALYEKARDKIFELALKNEQLEQENEDYCMKYDAMKEVVDGEKMRREAVEKNSKEMEKMIFKLKSEMESIKINYDEQIKMLSEHIISLTSNNKK